MKSTITFLLIIFYAKTCVSQCWQTVSPNSNYTIAMKTDGTIWGWGSNYLYTLGTGTTLPSLNPIQVGTGNDWLMVKSCYNHTMAIKTDGTLWGWGNNYFYQLGDGTQNNKAIPFQIGTENDWQFVDGNNYYTIAIKNDGTLWSWGFNGKLTLGFGDALTSIHTPTQVGVENDWQTIAASEHFVIALKTNGTLWTWGSNYYGELGNGTTDDIAVPTQMGVQANWEKISIGDAHVLALKTDGSLWAWGANDFTLGDGTTIDRKVPTHIGTDTDWQSISAGVTHSAGIKTDGSLWVWGENFTGELGISPASGYVNVPTNFDTENVWESISLSWNCTHGLQAGNSLFGWGENMNGKIGDGTTNNYDFPINIECQPLNNIESTFVEQSVLFYPNPSENYVIFSNSNISTYFQYQVLDLAGRIIKSGNSHYGEIINIEGVDSGNYLVSICDSTGTIINKKMVKK